MVSGTEAESAPPIYPDLEPAERRRLIIRGSLRATLSSVVLVVIYYTLPLSGKFDAAGVTSLIVGLPVLAIVLVVQIRAIISSRYPFLAAVEVVGVALPLLLLIFASTYLIMAEQQHGAFSESLNRTGALYFTVTVFSTVGFGDIVPKTDTARVVTMVQMLIDLVTLGLIVRLIVEAVKLGQQRRLAQVGRGDDPASPGSE